MLAGPLPVLAWEDALVLIRVFISFSSLVYLLKIGTEALIGVGFYLWLLSFLLMGVACFLRSRTTLPNQSPEPTAVGAGSSAVAVHAASRRWLSFFR